MYMQCKEWLEAGGAIDNCNILETDLTSIEFTHNKKDQILLEAKEHMKERGLASPDDADALVMSFAFPIPPLDIHGNRANNQRNVTSEWDPYQERE